MLLYKFSCLLNNSETLGDFFAKLATNIKHRQFAEIKNHTRLHCLRIYARLEFSVQKLCLLCNFNKAVKGIYIKLGTNIKFYQMICREQ